MANKHRTRKQLRGESNETRMMGCFSSGLMTDPFTHDSDELLNIATGVVLPEDVAQNLARGTEKGRQQKNAFVEKRINSNAVGFWEPIPNMKIKTFSSTNKKIRVKSIQRQASQASHVQGLVWQAPNRIKHASDLSERGVEL